MTVFSVGYRKRPVSQVAMWKEGFANLIPTQFGCFLKPTFHPKPQHKSNPQTYTNTTKQQNQLKTPILPRFSKGN